MHTACCVCTPEEHNVMSNTVSSVALKLSYRFFKVTNPKNEDAKSHQIALSFGVRTSSTKG